MFIKEKLMNVFVTADQHYYHDNIIKFCNRPFVNVQEMNELLIERHNNVVSNQDVVFIVGDFYLNNEEKNTTPHKLYDLCEQLNGTLYFIPGSHDYWMRTLKDTPISANGKEIVICNYIHEYKYDEHFIVFCHYAMRVWPRSHYASYLLYGHSHGKIADYGRSTDVGVDRWNFSPIPLDFLMKEYSYNYVTTFTETTG